MKVKVIKQICRAAFITLVVVLGTALFLSVFFGAALQESYRLNPPTQQEIAEDPSLVRYQR